MDDLDLALEQDVSDLQNKLKNVIDLLKKKNQEQSVVSLVKEKIKTASSILHSLCLELEKDNVVRKIIINYLAF